MKSQKQQTSKKSTSPSFTALFLISLIFPVLAFIYLKTGPHTIQHAVFWVLPFWMILFADFLKITVQPGINKPGKDAVFSMLIYLLAALQVCNIWLLLEMASKLEWNSPLTITTSLVNLLAIKIIIGTSSSFSGIVTAHELIHKRSWHGKFIGRILLTLVCYEHFYTEHLYGHHCNVGKHSDPATARFGESFNTYWRRSVPAQFKHAWQLESKRLQRQGLNFLTLYRHHVFQGVAVEFLLIAMIAYSFGLTAMVAFLIQSFAAIRKLEAVNYIEHWGLERDNANIGSKDILSWETDSWITFHSLLGLSRHTDHHRHADKPFQHLDYCAGSPQLPYGYFASIFLSIFANKQFQKLATLQLQTNHSEQFQLKNPMN